ncbi:peroxiredoxin [Loktanella sp. DJP18]|uniref:peroxiredoxin n=1 Tax=Loktanella sp. DJP18 TaxID=3409788 RepID=UPI003BB64CB9
MTITTGDTLPDASVLTMGTEGPHAVSITDKVKGRTVVIFGLPGAYTGTCTSAHVPSFIRTLPALREKGVEEVICIAVNDPFVMKAWGDATGAIDAGITMLADAESTFTTAIGMSFSAPPVGFVNRSKRYAMLVKDGVVTILNEEPGPGQCDVSGGESLLAAMG